MFFLEIFNPASCGEDLAIHDRDAVIDIEELLRICLTLAQD